MQSADNVTRSYFQRYIAHTMGLVPATSPRNKSQGLVASSHDATSSCDLLQGLVPSCVPTLMFVELLFSKPSKNSVSLTILLSCNFKGLVFDFYLNRKRNKCWLAAYSCDLFTYQ